MARRKEGQLDPHTDTVEWLYTALRNAFLPPTYEVELEPNSLLDESGKGTIPDIGIRNTVLETTAFLEISGSPDAARSLNGAHKTEQKEYARHHLGPNETYLQIPRVVARDLDSCVTVIEALLDGSTDMSAAEAWVLSQIIHG